MVHMMREIPPGVGRRWTLYPYGGSEASSFDRSKDWWPVIQTPHNCFCAGLKRVALLER